MLGTETGGLGPKRKSGDHSNYQPEYEKESCCHLKTREKLSTWTTLKWVK